MDLTLNITKFRGWICIFLIYYFIQPFLVYRFLLLNVRNIKDGKDWNGNIWTKNSFTSDFLTTPITTDDNTADKLMKEYINIGRTGPKDKVNGSRIINLLLLCVVIYIFGNWDNNLPSFLSGKMALILGCATVSSIGFELIKNLKIDSLTSPEASMHDFVGYLSRKISGKYNLNLNITATTYLPTITFIILFFLIFIIIPYFVGLTIYTNNLWEKLNYTLIMLCSLIIFIGLPAIPYKGIYNYEHIWKGLATTSLLICRYDTKFFQIIAGFAIGIVSSQTHWIPNRVCDQYIHQNHS